MKRLLVAVLMSASLTSFGQTFTRHVEPFKELKVARGVKATLFKSNSDELSFEVHGLSKDDIIVDQEREMLTIKVRTKSLWESMQERDWWVKVKIPYQEITSIDVSTGAEVEALNVIKSEELYIDATMGAVTDLEVDTQHLTVDSSMGAVTELEGKTSTLNVDASMGAVIKAYELEAKYVRAEASMGSEVKLFCSDEFDGSASMGAEITVKGKPQKWFENESMGGDIDGY
ncbi:MAG: DUF2807 domain-containing protein [Cyclobacteriaceae bacterium]|nr:DUF2807 domain-containing protein [Cyclobacteriaceae bacterium]